ncbi:N-acetylmuramoyl-L-alanine amidase [Isoptericola sp. NPDC055881]
MHARSFVTAGVLLGLVVTGLVPAAQAAPHPVADKVTAVPAGDPPAAHPVPARVRRAALRQDARRSDLRTATADVTGYATVGITWESTPDAKDLTVSVRTSEDGRTWSPWEAVETEAGPDGRVSGTEPLVVGDVARVAARVTGPGVAATSGLTLAVVDPGDSAADDDVPMPALATSPYGAAVGTALTPPTAPVVNSRAAWGADESIMTWTPQQGQVRAATIHHTAHSSTANSYTAADVPAILRGIYAYHAKTLGWGDIGYNFLVDKFGRVWEGRAGGITAQTIGAHAKGYNTNATGISVLGNFDEATVPDAAVDAVVNLAAWKLALHGVKADGSTTIGDSTLPTIFGHRDVAATACPGASLYQRLPEIRRRAAAAQVAAAQDPTVLKVPHGTFVRLADGTVGMVENGRRHLASCWVVQQYGATCAGALPVTSAQWGALTAGGRLYRTLHATDGRIFFMQDGVRREVYDAASLTAAGQSTTAVRASANAISRLPYGKPVVRGGVVVVSRSTGSRWLVVNGRRSPLPSVFNAYTPLGALTHRKLDSASVSRMTTTSTTNGVVRLKDTTRKYLLTTRGLVRIDGTGSLRSGTDVRVWDRTLKRAVPTVSDRAASKVALRVRDRTQLYVLRKGVLHPVASKARLTKVFGGTTPPIRVVLRATRLEFPVGSAW